MLIAASRRLVEDLLAARADASAEDPYANTPLEYRHALGARLLREADVRGELGELVAGKKPPRWKDREITIADLTGVGLQDTAIASLAYERLASRT